MTGRPTGQTGPSVNHVPAVDIAPAAARPPGTTPGDAAADQEVPTHPAPADVEQGPSHTSKHLEPTEREDVVSARPPVDEVDPGLAATARMPAVPVTPGDKIDGGQKPLLVEPMLAGSGTASTTTPAPPDHQTAPESQAKVSRVVALAKHKSLPVDFLSELGLVDGPAWVLIPYDPQNEQRTVRFQLRKAPGARLKWQWAGSKGWPIIPYGVWRLEEAKTAGYLIIACGESDCWTLWLHEYPALGLPGRGAQMTKKLEAEHLTEISRVVIIKEQDDEAAAFVGGVRARLRNLSWPGEVRVLTMPEGVKDPSELHKLDSRQFKSTFNDLRAAATAQDDHAASGAASSTCLAPVRTGPPRSTAVVKAGDGQPDTGRAVHDDRDRVTPDAPSTDPGDAAACMNGRDAVVPDAGTATITTTDDSWPAKLGKDSHYGLAGEILQTIEPHSEADPASLLIHVLTFFGDVVGRKPHFRVENDRHGVNLFAVTVGETANSRKGTAAGRAKQVFEKVPPPPEQDADTWSGLRCRNGLSTGEGLIWHVRDPIPSLDRNRADDPGESDKRLCVLESEFAQTLKVMNRPGNTLSPVLRNAWDGHDVLETLTKTRPARATGAHISVFGHITQDELLRHLTTTEAGSGFANRFLWNCARRSKNLPRGSPVPADALERVTTAVAAAVAYASEVDELDFDDEANELWYEEYPQLGTGRFGLFGAVTARAEPQVLRLSCIYALMDRSNVVRAQHLRAGLAVWKYCKDSARYIFGDLIGDPDADEIRRALRLRPEGLTRTEIRNLFQRNRRAEDISRALSVLERHGLARRQDERTGGRPTERWISTEDATTKTT